MKGMQRYSARLDLQNTAARWEEETDGEEMENTAWLVPSEISNLWLHKGLLKTPVTRFHETQHTYE